VPITLVQTAFLRLTIRYTCPSFHCSSLSPSLRFLFFEEENSFPLSLWMDYDFRTRSGQSYEAQFPMYRTVTSSSSSAPSSHPMYGPSLYPRVGQPGPTMSPSAPSRPAPSPYHHHHTSTTTSSPACTSNSSSTLYFDLI
jgi:hypothetical protein